MGKRKKKNISHVEFGNEFGDLNAAKNYEIPEANRKKKEPKSNMRND